MLSEQTKASLRTLYAVFKEQGTTQVYLTQCCNKIFLGDQPARKCRTCDKHPTNVEITDTATLDNL